MDTFLIGKRMRDRRLELGYSLEEVAASVGVATSTIQRYEAGRISQPKMPVIEVIARALDVSPAWLIGKSNDPQQSPTHGDDNRDDDVLFALFGKHAEEITDEDMEDVRLALELVKKLRRDKEGH